MTSQTVPDSFDIPEDDATIAAALQDASIPTLMMSMIHMSGDPSVLDGALRPAGAYINEYQGYMSEEDKTAVRAQRPAGHQRFSRRRLSVASTTRCRTRFIA